MKLNFVSISRFRSTEDVGKWRETPEAETPFGRLITNLLDENEWSRQYSLSAFLADEAPGPRLVIVAPHSAFGVEISSKTVGSILDVQNRLKLYLQGYVDGQESVASTVRRSLIEATELLHSLERVARKIP
jgi:hypothetical protein